MLEQLAISGGWGWLIVMTSFALLVLMIAQVYVRKTKDLRPVIWGIFFFVLLFGPMGTLVGLNQACAVISEVESSKQLVAFTRGLGVSTFTSILGFAVCAITIIPLKIVSSKVSKHH